MKLHVLVVHDGRDPAQHLLASLREEILHLRMAVKGMIVRVKQFFQIK